MNLELLQNEGLGIMYTLADHVQRNKNLSGFAGFPSSSGGADEIFIIPLSSLTIFVSEIF